MDEPPALCIFICLSYQGKHNIYNVDKWYYYLKRNIMRNLFILLFTLGLFACSDKQTVNNQENLVSLISKIDKDILREIEASYDTLFTTTRSVTSSVYPNFYTALKETDNYTQIPYYELDKESFYGNPSAEKLMECLHLSEKEKWFIGYNSKDTMLFVIQNISGNWDIRTFTNDWNIVQRWLPAKLKEAGVTNYKLFRLGYNEYVTFDKNSKPVFYHITGGEEMSAEKFCEKTVEYINNGKKYPVTETSIQEIQQQVNEELQSRQAWPTYSHGYYYARRYPFQVENQFYEHWCAFAALASHPRIPLSTCQVATAFIHKHRSDVSAAVNCCNLIDSTSYQVCLWQWLPTTPEYVLAFAYELGIPCTRMEPLYAFVDKVIRAPYDLSKYPFIMILTDQNPGHVGLLCGAQIIQHSSGHWIEKIFVVWGNPANGMVLEEYVDYASMSSQTIKIFV